LLSNAPTKAFKLASTELGRGSRGYFTIFSNTPLIESESNGFLSVINS